jgi:6-phosphogluconolactonase/glucosamine-6-phosphate isomerase/deaminase
MNIIYYEDYESLSVQAASLVISEIEKRKNLLVCAAAGNSPSGLYKELARKSETDSAFFAELRVMKLDEWGGIPENDPESSEWYLRMRLLGPVGITPERYISFAILDSMSQGRI